MKKNNVGFLVYLDWAEFGYSEVLYSWFSTICYSLEDKEWGNKYPIIMKKLYYDEEKGIEYQDIKQFEEELIDIQERFKELVVEEAIWSFEDMILEIPDSLTNINYEADSLYDFYIANNGKNIFELLFECIDGMHFFYKEYKTASLCIRDENNI